ncbi:hypothetical protein F5890DRAFT_1408768 [Lentinula detonsa]|uniref:Uncharacterized protein n=1 Tax=Lentinula detonsa TaxID=2804962 RepID=A0AA38UUP4_9AGAR|nr:hypothetical protein F5890DRAFT_1408768 [Lentinula detonsa]
MVTRNCFLDMTHRKRINHFEDYRPVADTVASNYENYNGPGPGNDSSFLLFFGFNWRKSRWNRSVVTNTLPVIIHKKGEVGLQGEVDEQAIAALLWDYIKQAQESWQRRNPRITQEGDRVETLEEARVRADTQALQRSMKVRRNSRKLTKFNKHISGIERMLQQPSLTAQDRARWTIAQGVVMKLGKDGQSTDETDTDGQGLHSTVPHYRRRFATTMLTGLDNSIVKLTQEECEKKGKRYSRPPALIRRRTDRQGIRTLVQHLPRSLYHQRFLNGLCPAALNALEIDPVEIPQWNEWASLAMPISDTEPDVVMG